MLASCADQKHDSPRGSIEHGGPRLVVLSDMYGICGTVGFLDAVVARRHLMFSSGEISSGSDRSRMTLDFSAGDIDMTEVELTRIEAGPGGKTIYSSAEQTSGAVVAEWPGEPRNRLWITYDAKNEAERDWAVEVARSAFLCQVVAVR